MACKERCLRLLASLPKELEVLRMEVRLGTRRKIKSVLKRAGMDMQPTFETMFDAGIARAVLGHFWNDIRTQLPLIGAASERPEKILDALATGRGGKMRPGMLLQQLGAMLLVGSIGVRGAGAALSRHCSPRSWQRYKRVLKDLPLAACNGASGLKQVDVALARFDQKPCTTRAPIQIPRSHHLGGGGGRRARPVAVNGAGRNEPASG